MRWDIYTDGSAKGNGQTNSNGGWGYCILHDGNFLDTDCGQERDTTNQRMELTAAIEALKVMDEVEKPDDEVVYIHSDSAYLINCQHNQWWKNWKANGWKNAKKQPVANQDLWELLIPYFKNEYIMWEKVKGHAGNQWNEVVDGLAQGAAEELKNGNSSN